MLALSTSVRCARCFCFGILFVVATDSFGALLKNESMLCSAFLLRAGKAPPSDYRIDPVSTLRRHFDVVISQLIRDSNNSIDVALSRLMQSRFETWSPVEVRSWRRILERRRVVNIRRLINYRQRGLFPINRDHTQPTPIFVDDNNTACAVGYLMNISGFHKEVASVAWTNNNVVISDVRSGRVFDWILYSGLTQEEAALIQPSYVCLPERDATLDQLAEESLSSGLFKYENFEISYSGDAWHFPEPEKIEVSEFVGPTAFDDNRACHFAPDLSHVLHIGARSFIARTKSELFQLTLSYDVVANTGLRLNGTGLMIDHGGNSRGMFLENVVASESFVFKTRIQDRDTGEFIAEISASHNGESIFADETINFPDTSAIRVETVFETSDRAHLSNFYHQFSVTGDDEFKGDVDLDGNFDQHDIDTIAAFQYHDRYSSTLDVTDDGVLDFQDISTWVKEIANTSFGDTNIDGKFDSSDLVEVFEKGHYRPDSWPRGRVKWSDGDWNADQVFNSSDLVLAFRDGGYERIPIEPIPVPEPSSLMVVLGVIFFWRRRHVRFDDRS